MFFLSLFLSLFCTCLVRMTISGNSTSSFYLLFLFSSTLYFVCVRCFSFSVLSSYGIFLSVSFPSTSNGFFCAFPHPSDIRVDFISSRLLTEAIKSNHFQSCPVGISISRHWQVKASHMLLSSVLMDLVGLHHRIFRFVRSTISFVHLPFNSF